MLVAKPLQAFTIGMKRVVSCKIPQDNPQDFLGKDVWFFSSQHNRKRIRLEGLSTASDIQGSIYDLHYVGCVILPEEISNRSVITDREYQEAVDRLCLSEVR